VSLLATAHFDPGVPSTSGKDGGWGGAPSEQFLLLPMTEVYELKVALKCGSGMWCDVLHTPKVLSSRAGKFDLHGPQVRTVWISYWILNTGYQIRDHSSFVHCLKVHKFNTFLKSETGWISILLLWIHNRWHNVSTEVPVNTAEATLVKRACCHACDRFGSVQGREITVWGTVWPIKCREYDVSVTMHHIYK